MSYTFDPSQPLESVTSSTGHVILLEKLYSASERSGVSVLVAVAALSLVSVVGLLGALAFAAIGTARTDRKHPWMRTHVMAYFISLLISDIIAAIGTVMNAQWIREGGVHLNSFCSTQGAIKNAGNVGTALWSLVLALHTFYLLALKRRSNDLILYVTLFVVWAIVGIVVVVGPGAMQNVTQKGPYFGISGYWCWITDAYGVERIALEYLFMFVSGFLSFLLYTAVFLCLRGNLVISGGNFRFRFSLTQASKWESQAGRDSADAQILKVARHMLIYPIAYTAMVLPIALCRFLSWAGHDVPFQATIFADALFMLSGFVNVVLFCVTRDIIDTREILSSIIHSRSASTSSSAPSSVDLEKAEQPYPFPYSEKKIVVSPTLPPKPAPIALQSFARPERPNPPPRTVSIAPTVASVYSEASFRASDAAPPVPTLPLPLALPVKQSRPSQRFTEVPLEGAHAYHEDNWSSSPSDRYSMSSYESTSPMREHVANMNRI